MKYKRILLKLSGEALVGDKAGGIDPEILIKYSNEIKKIYDTWVFSRDTTSQNPNWQLVNILT